MRRQLQINNGIAHGEWQGAGGMPVPPDASWTFLDVTNRPDAKVGMTYDANTNTFAPPLAPPKVLPFDEFFELFTLAERKALRSLATTNEDVADVLDLWKASRGISLAAPKTATRLQQLVTLGVLTAARRLAILNG